MFIGPGSFATPLRQERNVHEHPHHIALRWSAMHLVG